MSAISHLALIFSALKSIQEVLSSSQTRPYGDIRAILKKKGPLPTEEQIKVANRQHDISISAMLQVAQLVAQFSSNEVCHNV